MTAIQAPQLDAPDPGPSDVSLPDQDAIDALLPESIRDAFDVLSHDPGVSIRRQPDGRIEGGWPPHPIAEHWRQRAIARLLARLERYLCPTFRPPQSDQAALSVIRGTAQALEAAGKALDQAAWTLKEAGKIPQAVAIKQRSREALSAARELLA